jgi:hypothetical protein
MNVLTFNQSEQNKKFKNICTSDKSNNISSKKELLMESLIQFYAIKVYLDRIKDIISGNDTKNKYKISLRICDWFVTNYSKKYNISYPIVLTNNKKKNFIVYLDYKSQLKAYSKKQFDPFCRRERILFFDHEGKEIITTVGQLNFFRWCLENKILDYIEEHFEEIESDMNNSLRNLYKKKCDDDKSRRKRTELSISATKTVNKHDVSIIVQFD